MQSILYFFPCSSEFCPPTLFHLHSGYRCKFIHCCFQEIHCTIICNMFASPSLTTSRAWVYKFVCLNVIEVTEILSFWRCTKWSGNISLASFFQRLRMCFAGIWSIPRKSRTYKNERLAWSFKLFKKWDSQRNALVISINIFTFTAWQHNNPRLEITTRTCEFSALLNNFNFVDNPAPLVMLLWMLPSHKIGFAFTDLFHFVLPSFIQDFTKNFKHSSSVYIASVQFQ